MDTIGALKILIEADASGLTSQLKKAGSSITNFVGQMNKQEVNWTQILSRTISPAIISGIAATFALALTESLSFTNALTKSANTSTDAFAQNSAEATKSALAIQATTGQSAMSVVEAMGIATRALGSYASGQALVAEASKFALVTGIPLLDLINKLIPVMQQWGITDANKITTTIEDMFGAADQGRIGIMDLLQTMGETGAMLKGKTSIEEASAALEAFSNQAGNTATSAMTVFKKVALATFGDIQSKAQLAALGVGNIGKIVDEGGVTKAIMSLEESFSKLGTTSKIILGANAGFDSTTVQNLSDAAKSYSSIAKDSKTIMENENKSGKEIENNKSQIDQLKIAWGGLKTEIQKAYGDALLNFLTNTVSSVSDVLKGENLTKNVKFGDFMDMFGKNMADLFTLGQAGKYFNWNDSFNKGNIVNNTNNTNNNTYIQSGMINASIGAISAEPTYSKYNGYQ